MSDSDDFAAAGRRRQVRILATAALACIAIGVALAIAILSAGDTTGYSFEGHPGRPYGNWTKLFAILGAGFVAAGIAFATRAVRARRR